MNKSILYLAVFLFSILCCASIALYFIFRSPSKTQELVLYGNVDVRLVDVGFRVPGLVENVFFQEGDFVKAGCEIARLDKTPFDAELAAARANFASIEAKFVNAEILFNRRERLLPSQAVSQEDYDNAKASFEYYKAELINALSLVKIAEDRLSYTSTYALSDGILLSRVREPGTTVNPADPVCTISVLDPIWIRAFVNEPELGMISYGGEALIYTDTKNGSPLVGKIGFISPMAEFTPKTVQTTDLRTDLVYRLRIYVEDPEKVLKQGMPVTVKIPICQKQANRKP